MAFISFLSIQKKNIFTLFFTIHILYQKTKYKYFKGSVNFKLKKKKCQYRSRWVWHITSIQSSSPKYSIII